MSHDRGCPCGRERYEYKDCSDYNCLKQRMKKSEIQKDSLKVGDVFYSIGSKTIPSKSQHETREIDGEVWYKYTETKIKQHVIEYKILGILRKELEGEWKYSRAEGDLQTQYYVRYMDDTHVGTRIIDFYGGTTQYFVDKQDALDYISTMEK